MPWLLIAISSYLLGSIPWGFLFARAKGIDIRQKGSGNIGAANAFRVMGKKWGYLVFICDFLKGFLGHWHGDGNGLATGLISFRPPAFLCLIGEFVLGIE